MTSVFSNSWAAADTRSIASSNACSLAFDGLVNPESFLTNWVEAARTSSVVAGGSKLESVLIFLHIKIDLWGFDPGVLEQTICQYPTFLGSSQTFRERVFGDIGLVLNRRRECDPDRQNRKQQTR